MTRGWDSFEDQGIWRSEQDRRTRDDVTDFSSQLSLGSYWS